MMSEPILRLENICKSFFGVQVLYDISLELYEGEVLGLVGENGAGKSTMMNVVGGVLPGDSGTMYVNGKEYKPSSPRMATEAGIGFIHQELSLFTNLSVAENIFIDDYPKKFAGFIDKKETCSRTKGFLERYHVDVKNPNTVVGSLSMGTRQMIEILKALVKEAKILIFDEPTTSLSGREKETLFETIRELKKSGYSIVYISHILEDVLLLSDRISVLRDGHVIRTDRTANWTKEEMIRQMVGRDMKQVYPEVQKTIGSETVLETKGLCCAGFVKDVSLQLKKGEILGMFGLMGAGRSEVARAVFGVDPIESGEVIIKGTPFTRITPELCIRNKMAFIIFIILAAGMNFVLRNTKFGRHTMAIGNNPHAAEQIGINVTRHKIIIYVLCGIFAAVGGMFSAGQISEVFTTFGENNEFQIISATVIGGTSLFGGRGTILPGAIFGVLLIQVVLNGLSMMNASVYVFNIVRGVIIFIAVALDCINYKGELR